MSKHQLACPQCDLLIEKPAIKEGQKAICVRCGGKVADRKINSIERTLAVSLAGLLFLFPAISVPMIGIGAVGIHNESSLLSSIVLLIDTKFYIIAGALFIFTIAVPIVQLVIAFYISYSIKYHKLSHKSIPIFRSFHVLQTWAMVHVYFMGLIVSMYKLLSLAELTINLGLVAFIAFLALATYSVLTLDQDLVWQHLERTKCPTK